MSDWLDRTARRLAASDSAPPRPPVTAMTRRDAVGLAAGAGLALGAVRTLGPWLADARADDYCLSKCIKKADSDLAVQNDANRSLALHYSFLTVIGPARLIFLAAQGLHAVGDYSDYYAARSLCHRPNCGDPGTYPPPAAGGGGSPPPPNPPGCGNDARYVPCGDQPCCNLSYASCVSCSRGQVCCVNGGNCCG